MRVLESLGLSRAGVHTVSKDGGESVLFETKGATPGTV
jgi:hypothetical protein